jgi:hypothetical protein
MGRQPHAVLDCLDRIIESLRHTLGHRSVGDRGGHGPQVPDPRQKPGSRPADVDQVRRRRPRRIDGEVSADPSPRLLCDVA